MPVNIMVENQTTYLSLSYNDDTLGWVDVPFSRLTTLHGVNPPGLIQVGIPGGPPQQLNIEDSDPPQPPFANGTSTMRDTGSGVPRLVFTQGGVRISYRAYFWCRHSARALEAIAGSNTNQPRLLAQRLLGLAAAPSEIGSRESDSGVLPPVRAGIVQNHAHEFTRRALIRKESKAPANACSSATRVPAIAS